MEQNFSAALTGTAGTIPRHPQEKNSRIEADSQYLTQHAESLAGFSRNVEILLPHCCFPG